MEKLFTVEEVAQVTGLTSRTIRNYLKNGTLKGCKMGGQWRFTEIEVRALFRIPDSAVPASHHPAVTRFLSGGHEEKRVCIILDLPVSRLGEEEQVIERVMRYTELHPEIEAEHLYLPVHKSVRFVITAPPREAAAVCLLTEE